MKKLTKASQRALSMWRHNPGSTRLALDVRPSVVAALIRRGLLEKSRRVRNRAQPYALTKAGHDLHEKLFPLAAAVGAAEREMKSSIDKAMYGGTKSKGRVTSRAKRPRPKPLTKKQLQKMTVAIANQKAKPVMVDDAYMFYSKVTGMILYEHGWYAKLGVARKRRAATSFRTLPTRLVGITKVDICPHGRTW